jgi:UTP--glucose-1-phosphate uridylyltransferase
LEESNYRDELWYNNGVNILLEQQKDVYAVEIKGGKFHDCGNKLEYLKTVVEFGLKHEELAKDFKAYLDSLVGH